MNCIQISKEDGRTYPLYFTDTELIQIHQFVEYRNLEKAFINKLNDSYYQIDYWLREKHLEAIPELVPWLIKKYWYYHSADSSLNKILDLVILHFHNIYYTPELFQELMVHCHPAIPENPRYRLLSAALESAELHEQGKCSCSGGPKHWCSWQRYTCRQIEIQDFIAELILTKEENKS